MNKIRTMIQVMTREIFLAQKKFWIWKSGEVYHFLSKIYKRKSILGCLTVKIMSGVENRKLFKLKNSVLKLLYRIKTPQNNRGIPPLLEGDKVSTFRQVVTLYYIDALLKNYFHRYQIIMKGTKIKNSKIKTVRKELHGN